MSRALFFAVAIIAVISVVTCSQEQDFLKATQEKHYGNLLEILVQGSSVIAAVAVLGVMLGSLASEKLRLIQRYSLFSMLNHGYSIGSKAPHFDPLSAEMIAMVVYIVAYAVSRFKLKDTMEGDIAWLMQMLKGGGSAVKPVAAKDKTK